MEINTEHKAVFSWWTKPWMLWNYTSMEFHLCSRVIAIEFAKKLFKDIEIITDSKWKKIFDTLWYDSSTALDKLDVNEWFWAAGKLYTYSIQDKPFIHIDSDCFLWKQLPDRILNASLFAQNPETDDRFKSAYQWQIDYMKINNFDLPKWLLNSGVKSASCLWIVWWMNYKFISEYAKEALRIIKLNESKRKDMTDVWLYNVIFEQRLFDVMAKDKIEYLTSPAINKEILTDMWYQHLWWAKKDKKTEKMVIDFCKIEYPNLYNLILKSC